MTTQQLNSNFQNLKLILLLTLVCNLCLAVDRCQADTQPRIVNIYNFIRNSDYRVAHSEDVLFDTTHQQLELTKKYKLPATWALQYDALINPRYQKLLKEQAGPQDEIAGWWEIPKPLAEKAGLKWRGAHDWDSTANVGFSPGYSPDDRRKIVDVYMADFKAIFGSYPRTIGSWYIDEVTLQYMADKYGLVASCNCKDQVGTDGYTLHGGYWNQAYYPSKLNAYMPAQTKAGQIDVPIFRMLGSDPIYQYGSTRDMNTLEPVYPRAGGSADWVNTFMNNLITQPCLAFAYTQAGQENSFGWDSMKTGLTQQITLLAQQSKDGKIKVETLAESGEWFRRHFAVTPPTSVVAMDDWKHQGRKTVWYDSRFYRVNFLWHDGVFEIRDLHLFDEKVASATHDSILATHSLAYSTLPIMDGSQWSTRKAPAAIQPKLLSDKSEATPMTPAGAPVVSELNATDLGITQPLADGAVLKIICQENKLTFTASDKTGKPVSWAWDLVGGSRQKSAVQQVSSNQVTCRFKDTDYQFTLPDDAGKAQQLEDGTVRLSSNGDGKIAVILGASRPE